MRERGGRRERERRGTPRRARETGDRERGLQRGGEKEREGGVRVMNGREGRDRR